MGRLHDLLHRIAVRLSIDRLVARFHAQANGVPSAGDPPEHGSRLLLRVRESPAYPVMVGLLALISAATGLYPFAPVIVAATVFAPQRWRGVYLWAVLGAALGGMASAAAIQYAGPAFVDRAFPGVRQHEFWEHASYWIDQHGAIALAVIAALPLPQLPVLVVSALAGLPLAAIGGALALGKLAKYGFYILLVQGVLRVIHGAGSDKAKTERKASR